MLKTVFNSNLKHPHFFVTSHQNPQPYPRLPVFHATSLLWFNIHQLNKYLTDSLLSLSFYYRTPGKEPCSRPDYLHTVPIPNKLYTLFQTKISFHRDTQPYRLHIRVPLPLLGCNITFLTPHGTLGQHSPVDLGLNLESDCFYIFMKEAMGQ